MTKSDQNIKTLLDQWGRWMVRGNSLAIGYPSIAAFAKLRVDGGRSSGNELLMDDDLRRLNEFINHLRPGLKRVVACHYISAGYVKDKPAKLDLKRDAYFRLLQTAIEQLAHEMGGKYQIEVEDWAFLQPESAGADVGQKI